MSSKFRSLDAGSSIVGNDRGYSLRLLLAQNELPDRDENRQGTQPKRNEAGEEDAQLQSHAVARDGIGLACDNQSGTVSPLDSLIAAGAVVLILLGTWLIRSASSQAERFLAIMSLAGVVLSGAAALVIHYQLGCSPTL